MKGPIQSVEITYLIHATEDQQKVEGAIARVLAIKARPVVERLEGHFGNEILSERLHLIGEEANLAFQGIVARLPKDLKAGLLANIGAFLDEHSTFFLRLDKQQLVAGTLALGSADSVRLKVKPRLFLLKEGSAEFYARLIGGA
ncbi:MAG TPA: RNA-binding domain-containing protein [Nitrososphaerales archaeon]|nr:RNA-binding domain-containing protein [Nitrososphaerales archaeon]